VKIFEKCFRKVLKLWPLVHKKSMRDMKSIGRDSLYSVTESMVIGETVLVGKIYFPLLSLSLLFCCCCFVVIVADDVFIA